MELTVEQALQKGIEAHRAGKVQEADQYYTAILKANPKHPEANHNMGVLGVGFGKVEQAIPFFKNAIEANSNIAQFWLSYIDALIKIDRITDAKAVLQEAKQKGATGDAFDKIELQLNNSSVEFLNQTKKDIPTEANILDQLKLDKALKLANKKVKDGLRQEAKKIYQDILKKFPKNKGALSGIKTLARTYNSMAITLKEQGKLEEAIEAYTKALSIEPHYAEACYNMGIALQKQGKLEEAIEAYNKALSIKPDFAEAYYNIGILLESVIFNKPNRDLQKTIFSLLERETYVRPKDIAKSVISLLKLEPALQKHLKVVDGHVIKNPLEIASDLGDLPLLLELMSVCPLPSLELEKLLTNLRRALLSSILHIKDGSPELHRFQSALALQCFTNEYIYSETEEETKILQSLEARVKVNLENNEQPSAQVILALASYQALNQYDWCQSLAATCHIQKVFDRQIAEPNNEEKLKKQLPILEEITNSISSEVRAQYEQSPYPRWVNLGLRFEPMSIPEIVDEFELKLIDNKINHVKDPKILIAGCGTGQHSIGTAKSFKGSEVLAIDLSLSSLAYARRKTDELDVKNIEYMQADILDLSKLNKQFDIIESAGVLHHMDNPMEGWRVLIDCLKQGGLMKIGLYSELARQHIVKMRQEISEAGIGSNHSAMKSFRTMVMTSDQIHHKRILNSLDFYSLSTLKDLLFHVQEHRFTIPQIKDCLFELGLKFCGFEYANMVSNFKETNRSKDDLYDLDKWQSYEEANPRSFGGMYQFWCQKIN